MNNEYNTISVIAIIIAIICCETDTNSYYTFLSCPVY